MTTNKFCPKCKTYKTFSEFGILKSSKDGLSYKCKLCLRKKMKQWLSNPKNRERNNQNAAKYRHTEQGKNTKKRYYNSKKGQETYKKYNQETKKKKAREKVNHAVEAGKLPKAETQACIMADGTCEGRMEYHHYKGYGVKSQLDVIPLCRKHHCIIDGNNYHNIPHSL